MTAVPLTRTPPLPPLSMTVTWSPWSKTSAWLRDTRRSLSRYMAELLRPSIWPEPGCRARTWSLSGPAITRNCRAIASSHLSTCLGPKAGGKTLGRHSSQFERARRACQGAVFATSARSRTRFTGTDCSSIIHPRVELLRPHRLGVGFREDAAWRRGRVGPHLQGPGVLLAVHRRAPRDTSLGPPVPRRGHAGPALPAPCRRGRRPSGPGPTRYVQARRRLDLQRPDRRPGVIEHLQAHLLRFLAQ